MQNSLPFSRLTYLLRAIEDLPMPPMQFYRHRNEYDLILGKICIAESKKKPLTVSDITSCAVLGSTPTIQKRIKELYQANLIYYAEGDDKRQKFLRIDDKGHRYLEMCSGLLQEALI
jgi:hypothetical protein